MFARSEFSTPLDYDDDGGAYENDASTRLVTGDRVCPPASRSVASSVAQLAVVVMMAAASWQAYVHRDTIAEWLPQSSPAAPAASAPPLVSAPHEAAAPVTEAPREIADAPGTNAGVAAPPAPSGMASETGDKQQAASADSDTLQDAAPQADAPLPPPKVDPADPYQKKAMSAGLHPDISHAVLKRLSAADYKNAAVAVRTAIAETPDTGMYSYPAKPGAKLALFEVHFVQGAATGCRRYVVTITKDGWSTTAPAMEKCGTGLRAQQSKPHGKLSTSVE